MRAGGVKKYGHFCGNRNFRFRAPEVVVMAYLIFQTAAVTLAVWNYGIFRIFLVGIFLGAAVTSYADEMKALRAERQAVRRAKKAEEAVMTAIMKEVQRKKQKQKKNNRKKFNSYRKKR